MINMDMWFHTFSSYKPAWPACDERQARIAATFSLSKGSTLFSNQGFLASQRLLRPDGWGSTIASEPDDAVCSTASVNVLYSGK